MALRDFIRQDLVATRARLGCWMRWASIVVGALALLFVVSSLILALGGRLRFPRALAELEAEHGLELDFDLARLETLAPPPYDNAAEWWVEGAAAILLSEQEVELRGEAMDLPLEDWPTELEADVRALLDSNRPALDTLHAAVNIERSHLGIRYREGADVQLPNLLLILSAAKLLYLEGRLAFADGDIAKGLAAARTLVHIATALDQEHFMIVPLIGMASERYLLKLLAQVLANPEPWAASPRLLNQLEELIPTADRLEKLRELLLIESQVWSLGAIQGIGMPRYPPDGFRFIYGHWVAADALAGCRLVVEQTSMPFGRYSRFFFSDAPTLFEILGRQWGVNLPWLGGVAESIEDHVNLDELFVQGSVGAVPRFQRTAAERQLLHAAFALRRLGVASGGYPPDLPPIPELLRPDPWTGRRILARHVPDGSLALELDGGVKLWAEYMEDRRLGPHWRQSERLERSVERYEREAFIRVTLPRPPPPDPRQAFPKDSGNVVAGSSYLFACASQPVASALSRGHGFPAGPLDQAANRLIGAIAVSQDPLEMAFLLSAFPGLGKTIPAAVAQRVGACLIEGSQATRDRAELITLAHALKLWIGIVPVEVARELDEKIGRVIAEVQYALEEDPFALPRAAL